MSEAVYCVKADDLFNLIGLNIGFISAPMLDELIPPAGEASFGGIHRILDLEGQFLERHLCEEDPKFIQIIPYCMILRGTGNVMCKTASDKRIGHVYSYLRNTKAGEHRLHTNRSIGIGGHINPKDGDPNGTDSLMTPAGLIIVNAAFRECEEEIGIRPSLLSSQMNLMGIIYDPSNAVGQVHLGIIYSIRLRDFQEITKKDVGHEENMFLPLDGFEARKDEFESWSKLLLPIIGR
jgi:predicted NUDIX family phosphoesterase